MIEQNLQSLMASKGRQPLVRVFRYLEALNERNNPPQRDVKNYEFNIWFNQLPNHDNVSVSTEEYVLRIKRPIMTPCPPPPGSTKPWLSDGWDKPQAEPRIKSPEGMGEDSPKFEDEPERVQEFITWIQRWRSWAPVRKVENTIEKLYQDLYEQFSILERDGERYELLIGDGIAQWKLPEGDIRHPLLLQPVELTFDAPQAEFTVSETGRPVELYTGILRSEEIDPRTLAKARAQVSEKPEIQQLETVETLAFLKGLATSLDESGEFVEKEPSSIDDQLKIFLSPVLFRRNRNAGLSQAIKQVLDDLEEDGDGGSLPNWMDGPPEGLMRFVGLDTRGEEVSGPSTGSVGEAPEYDEETYFTKPANHEQFQIVRKLRTTGCVLVQGPPGTGKTHTIANLIGHLLAEGKSVLVTSHTTKALAVLADKVAKPLQPLCVSVLESDRENRNRVETVVQSMAEKLSIEKEVFARQARELKEVRSKLLARLRELRRQLRAARASEYQPIAYLGELISPLDAAKEVYALASSHGWIPGLLADEDNVPLTPTELLELYESNVTITPEDEANFPEIIPVLTVLESPDTFEETVVKVAELRRADLSIPNSIQTRPFPNDDEVLIVAINQILETLQFLDHEEARWKREIVELTIRGDGEAWLKLAGDAESLFTSAQAVEDLLLRVAPRWDPEPNFIEATTRCREIEEHLKIGKKLTRTILFLKQPWAKLIKSLRVADGEASTPDHFVAGRNQLEIQRKRKEFSRVWNGKMEGIDGPRVEGLQPERGATPFVADISSCVKWKSEKWPSLESVIQPTGLSIESAVLASPAVQGSTATVDRLIHALRDFVLVALYRIQSRMQHDRLEIILHDSKNRAQQLSVQFPGVPLIQQLAQAAEEEDADGYRHAMSLLRELYSRGPKIESRRALLKRLAALAPEWSQSVRLREGIHGLSKPPLEPVAAWRWKRLEQELTKRAQVSIQSLVTSIATKREECETTTGLLVEALSWGGLAERTTPSMRSSLTGYVQTLKRMGKGTGKRVPRLILDAQKLMAESRQAVPVWIMPLNRLMESFNVGKTKFDVVIVDEASQLDLYGLLAMYMARQVIIVGDDKQVEPLAVGTKLEDVQALIDEHLDGIPRGHLWDGQLSVYSLADGAFEPIRLREHFRCVPDIIRFSNQLSYDGSILPLREEAGVQTFPFVVPIYVPGAFIEGRTNRKEAEQLVMLLKACCERPEYAGKTFGVINLVGDEKSPQVELVSRLARQHIGDVELQSRKFRCGNSAQFQGDERDIMFLSIVDVPANGPLSLRTDDLFKKRYNVAASRARDQMWVIYSVDPNTDLKASDLRRELIVYALDPKAQDRLLKEKEGATESDFERRVLTRLMNAGFQSLEPQYWVGAYRLDFAIRQDRLRVAIECDGERFHGTDKLDEDLARQATLERLGWKFVRIRGSEFYRYEERTISAVCRSLEELGVVKPRDDIPDTSQDTPLLEILKVRASELLKELHDADDEEESTLIAEPELTFGEARSTQDLPVPEIVAPSLIEPENLPRGPRGDGPGTTANAAGSNCSEIVVGAYVTFVGTDLPDPKTALMREIVANLVQIITIEGPATVRTVLNRYRVGVGYGRLKGPTREIVQNAVSLSIREGLVQILETDPVDPLGNVVFLPNQPTVRLRERGPRDLDDIPISEIALLAETLGIDLDDEELAYRKILAFYDLRRLTEGARRRIVTALKQDPKSISI